MARSPISDATCCTHFRSKDIDAVQFIHQLHDAFIYGEENTSPVETTHVDENQTEQESMQFRNVSSDDLSTASSSTKLIVIGYTMRSTECRVMYHIDVQHKTSQLEKYTIRRSYTDFRKLHTELIEVLNEFKPKRSADDNQIEGESESYKFHTEHIRNDPKSNESLEGSTSNSNCSMLHPLPPLPYGGVFSYWKRHDRTHLQQRCDIFQELLDAITSIDCLRESYAFETFLSTAPGAIRKRGSSYVSLCEYDVPQVNLTLENKERKQKALASRRHSSAQSLTTLSVGE